MTASAHAPNRPSPRWWHTFVATLAAGVGAMAVASFGMTGVYAVLGLLAAGAGVVAIRGQLQPYVDDGLRRARAATLRSGPLVMAPTQRRLLAIGLVVFAGVAGFAAATAGLMVAIAAAAIPVLVVGLWFAWPAVTALVLTPPEDLLPRPRRKNLPAAAPRAPSAIGSFVVVGVAGVAAFFVAGLGFKGLLVAVAMIGGGTALILVRDRSSFGMFAATVSLTFVLHKSLSAQALTVSGGAISVYVTTFDAMLLVLIGLWVSEGTFMSDLRVGMRRRIMWLPLIGALFLLPSMLASTTPLLAVAELTRMGWMYVLFVYIAIRVRTRRQVGMVLAGLAAFAVIELVIIMLQWKTGGVLGLDFLGVPTELGERVTDTGSIGRPFGTIIHPVFMGAVMSSIGLVALSVALAMRNSLARTVAWLTLAGCLGAMYLAHTRAALVAFMVVAVGVVWQAWRRGDVSGKQLKRAALVGLVCFMVALPVLVPVFEENFGTGHFFEEVDSRQQLNVIGLNMWVDHPVVGVGLNNFEQVMGPYQQTGIIFFNNPVHNVYLLYLAETGIVGFVGLLIAAAAVMLPSFRLARARDPFLRSIGRAVFAVAAFLAVEELLGFSLRQDIPLAMLWLLAGLSVAGLNIADAEGVSFGRPLPRRGRPASRRAPGAVSSSTPTPATTSRSRVTLSADRRRWRAPAIGAALVLGVPVLPSAASAQDVVLATAPTGLTIVFSASDRSTGQTGIYVAGADRKAVRITPADGMIYSWPQFAFGASKIVYTSRAGASGSPESIYLMNPDGSSPELIRRFEYRVAQPKVSLDGTTVIFTGVAPWYPLVGIYSMDLRTGSVTNLSALDSPTGAADSDPSYSADGRTIVFGQTRSPNTQIAVMDADGANRHELTRDQFTNVDPDLSPSKRDMIYSSYRGAGSLRGTSKDLEVAVGGWKIVTQPTDPNAPARELTQGLDCTTYAPDAPCSPDMAAGFKPRYTPDGSAIGFVAALDTTHTCICTIGVDGSNPAVYLAATDVAIDWFDWVPTGATSPGTFDPSAVRGVGRALLVTEEKGVSTLSDTDLDFTDQVVLPLPKGLRVTSARWASNGDIVLAANSSIAGLSTDPHPAPPPGQLRRDHFTYDQLLQIPHNGDGVDITEQLFLRRADGSVTRLTDPWSEDWRDGLREGDARSNTQPRVAPDGRSVLYTSTSRLTGESFLMRLDLITGEVLNLTNGTSGAAWVNDQGPALSPWGDATFFTTTVGSSDVWMMDAATGYNAHRVTDDDFVDASPVVSPDGRSVVYSSYRGRGEAASTGREGTVVPAATGWVLVRRDLASNSEAVLTDVVGPGSFEPEIDRSGRWVYFLRLTKFGPRIFRVPLDGSHAPSLVNGDQRIQRSVDFK